MKRFIDRSAFLCGLAAALLTRRVRLCKEASVRFTTHGPTDTLRPRRFASFFCSSGIYRKCRGGYHQKTTSELEYAYRIIKDRELVAELEARAPEVAEAEEVFQEAEKRLNELRGQQNDVQQERRMLKDGVVYVRDRLVQALQGPGFRSAGR